VTLSGRSLLRQASIVVVAGCALGAAVPALAEGPVPEPAPTTSSPAPKPEPVPSAQPPARQTTTTPPPPAVQTEPQAVQPPPATPAPQPSVPVTPPPAIVRTPVVTPTLPAPPRRAERRKTKQRTTTDGRTGQNRRSTPTGQQTRGTAATIARASASSPDTLLLIGGFALVVIVLGDTIFLTLSTRYLRQS
jgi:hypothetical protein